MMREMAAIGIFNHRSGSRERGQIWQTIATNLNNFEDFGGVTSRAVRDRFTTIMKKYKAQTNKDLKASGLGGDEPSEFENLMEDLILMSNESDLKQDTDNESKKKANDLEQKKGIEVRQLAMERLSETKKRVEICDEEGTPSVKKGRRSTTDTMDFLREKISLDKEIQENKAIDQQKEREFQRVQQQQSADMLKMFQTNMQQQSQQQNVMQQNLMAMMNNQQQQFQAFMTVLMSNKNPSDDG